MAISTTKVESIRTKALDGLEADLALYAAGDVGGPIDLATLSKEQILERVIARNELWIKRVETASKIIRWCQYRLGEEAGTEGFSLLRAAVRPRAALRPLDVAFWRARNQGSGIWRRGSPAPRAWEDQPSAVAAKKAA